MLTVRGHLTRRLKQLEHRLLRMGSLVDEAIELSTRALLDRETLLARRVIDGDQKINKLRYQIEQECYMILATQQPLAKDLRRVVAAISISTNMERMADHAVGTAVLACRLNKQSEIKSLVAISRMAQIVRTMLRRSLDAYIQSDAQLASDVAEQDEEINLLEEQLLHKLISFMIQNPSYVQQATYILWISHNYERIGDRCKNICERVVYIVSGELADFDSYSLEDEHDFAPQKQLEDLILS